MDVQIMDRHKPCALYTEYDSINDPSLEHWQAEGLRDVIGFDYSFLLWKVDSRRYGQREWPMELPLQLRARRASQEITYQGPTLLSLWWGP